MSNLTKVLKGEFHARNVLGFTYDVIVMTKHRYLIKGDLTAGAIFRYL